MPRPTKQGLDYFPLDVDIDQDDAIQLLEAEFGSDAFVVIVKLFMKIYSEGYFYRFDNDQRMLLARRCGIDHERVGEIVQRAIDREVFHRGIFERHQVLTSRGIQKRFLDATTRRKELEIFTELLLLDVSGYKNVVTVNINQDSVSRASAISTQSKVKESKEKNTPLPPTKIRIDYDEVRESWNRMAKPLRMPTVEALSKKRKAAIRAKYEDVWPRIDEIYRIIRNSPWLRGENDRGWRCSFDFVWIRTDGYLKILEGTYSSGNSNSGTPALNQRVTKAQADELVRTHPKATSDWIHPFGKDDKSGERMFIVRDPATLNRKELVQ